MNKITNPIGLLTITILFFVLLSFQMAHAQTEPYPIPYPTNVPRGEAYPVYPVWDGVKEDEITTQSTTSQATAHDVNGSFPRFPVGWGQIPTTINGNHVQKCTAYDNRNDNQHLQWGTVEYLSNTRYATRQALWPAADGPDAVTFNRQGGTSYPADLDTTLRCEWDAYELWLNDSKIHPAQMHFEYDLFLNLADPNDYLRVTVNLLGTKNATMELWSQTYRSSQNTTDFVHIQTNDLTIPHNQLPAGAYWHTVQLEIDFVSDDTDETRIGALLADVRLWGNRQKVYHDCNDFDSNSDIASRAGINLGYRIPGEETFYIRPDDLTTLYDLQEMGIKWVRFAFIPDTSSGTLAIDYESYRFMIKNLCDRGIGVIPVIGIPTVEGSNLGAAYPGKTEEDIYEAILDDSNFEARYNAQLAELYRQFPDIRYWQLFNEPDVIEFFANEPYRFTALLKSAHDTIKAQNEDVTIIMGSLSNTWGSDDDNANGKGYTFLEKIYNDPNNDVTSAGVFSTAFDELGIHPYTDEGTYRTTDPAIYFYKVEEDLPSNWDSSQQPTIFEPLINLMQNNDTVGVKRLQMTEVGFNTSPQRLPNLSRGISGAVPGELNTNTLVTEAEQASYLTNAYKAVEAHSPSITSAGTIDKVIWYRYDDIFQAVPQSTYETMLGSNSGWQSIRSVAEERSNTTVATLRTRLQREPIAIFSHYFGIRDITGSPKPAYCAMQQVTGMVETCEQRELINPNAYVYLPTLQRPGIPLTQLLQVAAVEDGDMGAIPLAVTLATTESMNEEPIAMLGLMTILIIILATITTRIISPGEGTSHA